MNLLLFTILLENPRISELGAVTLIMLSIIPALYYVARLRFC